MKKQSRILLLDSKTGLAWKNSLEAVILALGSDLEVFEIGRIREVNWSNFQLILLDASGTENLAQTVSEILNESQSGRLIVLTPTPFWKEARTMFSLGVLDYVQKYSGEVNLRQLLRKSLERPPTQELLDVSQERLMMQETVLLADNNTSFRETMGEVLQGAGYDVILAENPHEACMILDSTGVDLALLDQRLVDDKDKHDQSGLELCLDPNYRFIPKIILTGYKVNQREVRHLMGAEQDELPAVVSFVGKDEGVDALIGEIRKTLSSWPRRRVSTVKVSSQVHAAYHQTRKQAGYQFVVASLVSLLGFGVIFVGIGLAIRGSTAIALVGAISGILIQVFGFLFYKQLEQANTRLDNYHNQILQTYWLELLIATCEQLPAKKQAETEAGVIQLASKNWLAANPNATNTRNSNQG